MFLLLNQNVLDHKNIIKKEYTPAASRRPEYRAREGQREGETDRQRDREIEYVYFIRNNGWDRTRGTGALYVRLTLKLRAKPTFSKRDRQTETKIDTDRDRYRVWQSGDGREKEKNR